MSSSARFRAARVRVLVVDDFPLIREGLATALKMDPAIEVVGLAENGLEALEEAHRLKPDVAIVDLHMPELGGLLLLERLADELPEVRALVVTASERAEHLLDAVAAGAAGYLTKRVDRAGLCRAVLTVHAGGSVITPTLAGHLLREYSRAGRDGAPSARPLLTPRERDLLRFVAQGLTDVEIGQQLHLSRRTVQNHLTQIRHKTGLRRRAELTRWAVEHALT